MKKFNLQKGWMDENGKEVTPTLKVENPLIIEELEWVIFYRGIWIASGTSLANSIEEAIKRIEHKNNTLSANREQTN